MAEANLVAITDVKGRTYSQNIADTSIEVSVGNNVAVGNSTWVVKGLTLSNVSSNSTDNQVDVYFQDTSNNVRYILYGAWIPYGTSLVVIDQNTPIYLNYNEEIWVGMVSGTNTQATFKYETLTE